MNHLDKLSRDPRAVVFDVMEEVRAGMLGLTAAGEGPQPMTHFADAESGLIWFISSTETDLVQSLDAGEDADYLLVAKDHDAHIHLHGKLYHDQDAAQLDLLWNPVIGAWFEGGRDDPHVALLRFAPEVAHIWASSTSTLKFGIEMARAKLDATHKPDIGRKATVRF